jgi:glutaminase
MPLRRAHARREAGTHLAAGACLIPGGRARLPVASAADVCPISRTLGVVFEHFRPIGAGSVASYIPELARADPAAFGISLATADGHVYEVGDTRLPFTIQSVSKPFVYGLALEDRGKEAVLARVGVEPTGDAFNEISLESSTGRPRNPMINAGAITATSLVAGHSVEDRWARILKLFSSYAGRSLGLDETVYRSERETGHRNRAISHMLRNFGIIEHDPETDLDLYFRQCSIEVTCHDLAMMGATLAAGGTNPLTRERALRPSNVDEVLSVMTTCGMYDYSGGWLYRVGLPAKSGVSGGILAILPGQLALAVYSPPLDERGNSVRGVAVCEAISNELELHFLHAPRHAVSPVRSRATVRAFGSKRIRFDSEREILDAHGHEALVYQLHGELSFAGMEAVIRRLVHAAPEVSHFVLDFGRVTNVDPPSARLLQALEEALAQQGRAVAFSGISRHPRVLRLLDEARARNGRPAPIVFDELEVAVEWCENALLAAHGAAVERHEELPLSKHELLRGLGADELEWVAKLMERRSYAAREIVVRKDDAADELFLLVDGALSVLSDLSDGRLRRLATLSPGMGFGEPSMLEGATRTAFVRADRPSVCWVLKRATFASLDASCPALKIRLLENFLRSTTKALGRLSLESLAERV